MSTIADIINRLEAIKGREEEIIEDVFIRNEKTFADKQREQLYAGFDINGKRLKEYRNSLYAEFKHRMNPLPGEGNPDFKLTGAFYRGIEVRIDAPVIRTVLNDPKSGSLLKRDPDIIGLSAPYKSQMTNDVLKPEIIKEFRNRLKL